MHSRNIALSSLSCLVVLSACSVGKITDQPTPPSTGTAGVELLHLAAALGPVDVFVAGEATAALRGLAYDAAPARIVVTAGRVSLDVVLAGQRLRTLDLNLESGRVYRVVVLDDRDVLLETTDVPSDGRTAVRLIHAAPGVGAIDVWDVDASAPLVRGLGFGSASGATPIGAGTSRLGIDVDADGTADLVYDLGALPPATVVDVYAMQDAESVFLRSYAADGESRSARPEPIPVAPAQIRVLHLSPDAPNVDVLANQGLAVENLEFTRGTGFLELEPGTYTFDVTATGQADVVQSATLPLEPGAAFTAIAFDAVANLQILALPESLETVASGARIRVVHAAVGVGAVDVLDADTGDVLLDDVPFGAASAQFLAPAGVHSFGLDLDDDGASELVFDLPELPNGASANIFAVTDDDGAFLLVQLFDGTTLRVRPRHVEPPVATAQVRAIHLSPDAPAVNVFVDDDPNALVTALEFEGGTAYLPVAAGDMALSVSAGVLADRFLGPLSVTLTEDANYSAVVFDLAAQAQVLLLEDDLSPPAAGNTRLRAVHTAAGIGPVNIIVAGAPLYEDLAFGTAGNALELHAGTYVVGIDVDDDHHPDVSFALPPLPAGTVADAFAVADAHGAVKLVVAFPDGAVAVIPPSP